MDTRERVIRELQLKAAPPYSSIEELECLLCGKHIGWIYAFDLNGSYPICDDCKRQHGKT